MTRRAAPRALVPRKPQEDEVDAVVRGSSDGEASLLFTSARPAGPDCLEVKRQTLVIWVCVQGEASLDLHLFSHGVVLTIVKSYKF